MGWGGVGWVGGVGLYSSFEPEAAGLALFGLWVWGCGVLGD